MKLQAKISIQGDVENLAKLLSVERPNLPEKATVEVKKTKKDLSITVTTNDSVAFRATMNSIGKILSIYEKTRILVK